MRPPYIRAAIKAEIRRAARASRPIDRVHLFNETSLTWGRLEAEISAAALEMAAETFKK